MLTSQILSETRQQGIELRAEGDKLLFRSERRVPPELREAMRANKPELLKLLRLPENRGPTGTQGVGTKKLREAEKGFTCLDLAPPDVILCIAHPDLSGHWLAYRRTNRKQQGCGDSQTMAVLELAGVEGS